MKFYLKLFLLVSFSSFSFSQELDPPNFSHNSGFYTSDFNLTLTHDDGATILYTLDGSIPKIENLTGVEWHYKKTYPTNPGDNFGELLSETSWTYTYSTPLPITDISGETDKFSKVSTSIYDNEELKESLGIESHKNFKGITIRAVAYHEGEHSEVATNTYFISLDENRYKLPVINLSIDPIQFYDYDIGLNVPGKTFDDWRSDYPDTPVASDAPANYLASGSASEIPANFIYFEDGEVKVNQNIGLRLNGNSTKAYPNKSLRLYAKSAYGPKNIEYPFFEGYELTKFKRLILRNAGQDVEQAILRDPYLQKSVKDLNCITQQQKPVIVFINGEYIGIYYLIERYDSKYFDSRFGVDEDLLDFTDGFEIKEGNEIAFEELEDFVNTHSFEDDENFNQLNTMIDIDNFTDFFIIQTFSGNFDWPHSNTDFWRKQTPYDSTAEYGQDGRWRFLIKDYDQSLGLYWISADWFGKEYEYDNIERALNYEHFPIYNIFPVFTKLFERESYKNDFINRYCDVLNTSFKHTVTTSLFDNFKATIQPEVQEFINRWNPNNFNILQVDPIPQYPVYTYSRWDELSSKIRQFMNYRPHFVRQHISQNFDSGKSFEVALNVSDIAHGLIKINTITIDENTIGNNPTVPYPWYGEYFENVPIKLTALPKEGYKFSHWSGSIFDTQPSIEVDLKDITYVKANFIKTSESPQPEEELILFPNPFSNKLSAFASGPIDYSIYSLDGQLMKKEKIQHYQIDITNLSSGTYIFVAIVNGKKFTKKIIKL